MNRACAADIGARKATGQKSWAGLPPFMVVRRLILLGQGAASRRKSESGGLGVGGLARRFRRLMLARCPVQARARIAIVLALCVLAAMVGGRGAAIAQNPSSKPCAAAQCPAAEDAECRDCSPGRRVLCPACRARLASGRAFQGPLIPLAAQVADTPFPRFHPVPTRPVFLPPWVGPPADAPLPEAPRPPLLKHLPPAALPEGQTGQSQARPLGGDNKSGSTGQPRPIGRPGSDGWRARSPGAVQTSWLFHPAVASRLELEPQEASHAGRTARRAGLADLLR